MAELTGSCSTRTQLAAAEQAGACAGPAGTGLTGARWRTSSRSSSNGGDCVEVADNLPGVVAVRDSKDPTGPALAFSPTAWRTFVSRARQA